MGANLKLKEEKISFLRKQSHTLKPLQKSLAKEVEDAVRELVKLMESDDPRMKFQASKAILDYYKDISAAINTDDIQRMLLESKNPDRVTRLVEDDDTPQINFDDIQDV